MFNVVQFVKKKLGRLQTDVTHKLHQIWECNERNSKFIHRTMINDRTPIECWFNPKITSEKSSIIVGGLHQTMGILNVFRLNRNYFISIIETMQSMQMLPFILCTIMGNKTEQLIDIDVQRDSPHNGTMGRMETATEICVRNRFHVFHCKDGPSTIEKYLNQHQAPTKCWVNKRRAWNHLPQVKAPRLLTNGKLCNIHHRYHLDAPD